MTLKSLTIKKVPSELLDRLKAQAEKEGRWFHQFIIRLLYMAIEEREREETDGK